MSEASGQKEQTTSQDGLIAENLLDADASSNQANISQKEDGVERTNHEANTEIRAPAETVTPTSHEPQQNGNTSESQPLIDLMDVSAIGPAENTTLSRTAEIEREASEHLAQRAAEMTTDSHGEDPDILSNDGPAASKTELPESPSAPAVPEKDTPPSTGQPVEQEFDEKHPPPPEETRDEVPDAPQGAPEATGLEIQTIMEQFQDGTGGPGEEEIMSPRLERQQPILMLPPRTSSLENRDRGSLSPQTTGGSISSLPFGESSEKPPSISTTNLGKVKSDDTESITSAKAGSIFQPPPPSPDPEPAQPFDFHRFLEQLRHRTADPVARFLRSFLNEFGKKQWAAHEQVKIISDFLEFIAKKMAQCEVWRTVSDAEFDNAREGMEKLVMNRLYSQTFSPAIPPPAGSPRKLGKGNRTPTDMANPHGPGRRGQHQEDVERDDVIAQKITIYGWISEEHLDIKPITDKGRKFLTLAQQELLKINSYRAPRDKVICVLNACKVIFGFLKNSRGDQSADAFVPLLIYTVLRAKPEHLVSNVQYIWRFRNQDKLGGEAGYYMSSLMGVVTFIENLDRTNITISDEEFERNVEQAVSAIAEKNKAEEYESKSHAPAGPATPMQRFTEKSSISRPEVTPRNSMEPDRSSPRRNVSQRSQHSHQASTDTVDDFDAVTGLLKTIGKPLSTIGRIFSDDSSSAPNSNSSLRPASTPLASSTPRGLSPVPNVDRRPSADGRATTAQNTATDAAARQASAEAAQAQRIRAKEYKVVVE
jgi:Rab5 GDP/GTP exchange factor